MGARNVVDAYRRWAGRVPGTSMQLLVYMAVVSKDSDDWPWYGQGQASLAEFAMGRENPDRSDLRAVSRAMGPLLDAGAVSVDRAGAARGDGNTTARYRLNLSEAADEAREKWEQTYDGKRRASDARREPRHTTKSGRDIRRFPTQHTTVSDATYDGNRRTKEKEKTKRSEKTEEEGRSKTASHPPRATDADVIPIDRSKRPTGRAQQTLIEAALRREAARQAHATTKPTDDTTEVS
jgi:hypothetical protein